MEAWRLWFQAFPSNSVVYRAATRVSLLVTSPACWSRTFFSFVESGIFRFISSESQRTSLRKYWSPYL